MTTKSSEDVSDATESTVEIPRAMDLPRIERAVREILQAMGEDPDRDGSVSYTHLTLPTKA